MLKSSLVRLAAGVVCLNLIACDPQAIDPASLSAAGGSADGPLGLFELIADDFSGGDLRSADIDPPQGQNTYGDPLGTGTASNPLELGMFGVYDFYWNVSVSEQSNLYFYFYAIGDPSDTIDLASIDCTSGDGCGSDSMMSCHYLGQGVDPTDTLDYSTQLLCKSGDKNVEIGSSAEGVITHYDPDWPRTWGTVDLDLGIGVRLCSTANVCDYGNLGYIRMRFPVCEGSTCEVQR